GAGAPHTQPTGTAARKRAPGHRIYVRLYLMGAGILFAGLASAAWVYVTARDSERDAVSYEVAGGNVYAVSPEDSKRYLSDVERYGGKAAVLADEFDRWFSDLWHGTRLAYTLATLSIAVAIAFFGAAHLSARLAHDQTDDPDG